MNDDASTGERVRRMARRLARAMLRAEPLAGPGLELEVATVRADLPWRLEGAEGRRTGSGVEWLVEKAPTKKAQQAGFAALAEVAATLARGEAVDELRWVGVDGSQQKAGDPAELLAGFQDRLTLVTEMVQAGAYPGAGPAALRVDGAPASEVSEDWWQAWRDA